jgi:hypothetical protein
MLTIRPKVHGFKPVQGEGFLRAIKIHSTCSFGGEIKLEAPCCKILWHVKKSLANMNKDTFQGQIHHSLHLFQMTAGRLTRELWYTSQEFFSIDIIPPWFFILTYHLRD